MAEVMEKYYKEEMNALRIALNEREITHAQFEEFRAQFEAQEFPWLLLQWRTSEALIEDISAKNAKLRAELKKAQDKIGALSEQVETSVARNVMLKAVMMCMPRLRAADTLLRSLVQSMKARFYGQITQKIPSMLLQWHRQWCATKAQQDRRLKSFLINIPTGSMVLGVFQLQQIWQRQALARFVSLWLSRRREQRREQRREEQLAFHEDVDRELAHLIQSLESGGCTIESIIIGGKKYDV